MFCYVLICMFWSVCVIKRFVVCLKSRLAASTHFAHASRIFYSSFRSDRSFDKRNGCCKISVKVKVTMLMFVLGCRCSKLVNFAALMTMQAAQPRSICKGIAWLDLILIFLRAVRQALVHKSVFNEFCSIFEARSVQTDVLDSSMVPCKITSFARRWLKTWGQGRLYRVARSFVQFVGCQCSQQ